MSNKIDVIYNGSCPICSREIAVYRRDAENADAAVDWLDISRHSLPAELTVDQAARRLHVAVDGELLSGVPAFIAMWSAIPRWRWVARIIALPGIRHIASLTYDNVAAPALYALHRRRNRLPN